MCVSFIQEFSVSHSAHGVPREICFTESLAQRLVMKATLIQGVRVCHIRAPGSQLQYEHIHTTLGAWIKGSRAPVQTNTHTYTCIGFDLLCKRMYGCMVGMSSALNPRVGRSNIEDPETQ